MSCKALNFHTPKSNTIEGKENQTWETGLSEWDFKMTEI